MQRNGAYEELILSPFAYHRLDSGLRWQKMIAHPLRFRLKCYGKGIAMSVTRTVYSLLMKSPAAASWIEKKRYPIEL